MFLLYLATIDEVVGALGIEPRANGLKVRCSTAELRARTKEIALP